MAAETFGDFSKDTLPAILSENHLPCPEIDLFRGIVRWGLAQLHDTEPDEILQPHVKKMMTIKRVNEIIPAIRDAFAVAQDGVPGPVFIEYPPPLEVIWPLKESQYLVGSNTVGEAIIFLSSSLIHYLFSDIGAIVACQARVLARVDHEQYSVGLSPVPLQQCFQERIRDPTSQLQQQGHGKNR